MASPYHAHFDLRDKLRRLMFWLVLIGVALLASAFLFPTPFSTRVEMLVVCPACLGLAWGLHFAREWARIGGAILFGAAAVFLIAMLDRQSVGAVMPGSLCWSLLSPAMKRSFADARAMIRRTAEIKREKAEAQKRARERIAARRNENALGTRAERRA